jgi:hypothetical protein
LGGITPFAAVLADQPADRMASGHDPRVDLLIGSNSDESSLYPAPFDGLADSTEDDVRATAARLRRDPDRLVTAYRRATPGVTPAELRVALLGDGMFGAQVQPSDGAPVRLREDGYSFSDQAERPPRHRAAAGRPTNTAPGATSPRNGGPGSADDRCSGHLRHAGGESGHHPGHGLGVARISRSLVIAEFTSVGTGLTTGNPYNQQYISVVYTTHGKITRYVDFWNPLESISAVGDNLPDSVRV